MASRFSRSVRRLLGRADGTHAGRRVAARGVLAAAAAVGIGVGVAACGSTSSADSGAPIDVVAYSTPETVYKDGLIPAFKKTSEGSGADFSTSFGPSGDQSRAVESGQPASVVHFSIEPDMQRLVDAGKVASDWNQNEHDGFVQDSVVVFVVRKGNPDNIQNWDDLVKPGVEVLTPNPFSSGGARWNLMAAYGAQLEEGKSDAQAQDYLKQLLSNVALQAPSASDSMTAFTQGKGDVALAYENEAIAAQKAGEDVDYVIPDDTILIQTPIATTEDASTQAQDFVDWLYTPEAQQIWADNGYRPVDKRVLQEHSKEFPTPPGLFEIDKLGGWDQVTTKFFDETNGIVTKDEQDLGVSTSG
jgi:sulfate/thiosulfate transport system substrate-binding protein